MSDVPGAAPPASGTEWVVEAYGCAPAALRSPARLGALFDRAVAELGLKAVAPPLFHAFPAPGGVTGLMLLAESHLTIHTFPESRYAALNLYCCRPRPAWDFAGRLAEHLGAVRVEVKAIARGGLPPAVKTP